MTMHGPSGHVVPPALNLLLHRRTLLRGLGSGAALLAAGGLVTACGGTGQSAPGPEGASGSPAAQGGGGSFTFTAHSLNEEAAKDVVQGIVSDYSSSKGAEVSTASYPFNEALNQYVLQAQGGNLSGVVQTSVEWLSTFASLGILRDLGPLVEGVGYTEAALAAGQYEGVQYALPWSVASIGMIANTELLERAGVSDLPSSIEEFEAALDALKAQGGDTIPYAAMTGPEQLKDIVAWMFTFGGEVLRDGEVMLGDEGSVAAVDWYKGLLDAGYVAPGVDRFDARPLMAQGKVGFYDDAIIARGVLSKESPDPDFASKIVPMSRPVGASGEPVTITWGHMVVVVEDEQADAAADFARYLTSDPAASVVYFNELRLPPTTEEGLSDPAVTEDEFTTQWTERSSQYARTNPMWEYPQYARMEGVLAEQVESVLAGNGTAEEAMDRAREEITTLIG